MTEKGIIKPEKFLQTFEILYVTLYQELANILTGKHYLTSCDINICIYHLLYKTPINLKFHNWEMSSKKRIVTETARIAQKWIVIETARIIPTKENESFEKTELFLRNLIWNSYSKQSQINEAAVKVIFIVKSTR